MCSATAVSGIFQKIVLFPLFLIFVGLKASRILNKQKKKKKKRKSGLKNWRRVRSGTAGASNKQTNRQTDRKAAIFFSVVSEMVWSGCLAPTIARSVRFTTLKMRLFLCLSPMTTNTASASRALLGVFFFSSLCSEKVTTEVLFFFFSRAPLTNCLCGKCLCSGTESVVKPHVRVLTLHRKER